MRTRLLSWVPLAALAGAAFAPALLEGQASRVWVEPRIGIVLLTGDLGRTDVISGNGFADFGEVDAGASLGVGVGVTLTESLALRGSVDRALDAGVQGEWKCAPFVACPAVILKLDGDMSRWTVALDALYRPAVALPLDPVLFAGVGFRTSEVTWAETTADINLPAFAFDETALVYRLGLGLEGSVGGATLFGEFGVSASRFGGDEFRSIEGTVPADDDLAVNVGLLGGVRIRLN